MSDSSSGTFDYLKWQEGMDPKSLVGKVISKRYEIVRHLGGGGFGEVYIAVNIGFREQKVVIKFLKNSVSEKKFAQEASILCKLNHPNICNIIDFLSNERALVMQFIDGYDCAALLDEPNLLSDKETTIPLRNIKKTHQNKIKPKLSDELILKIVRAVASAITYAHSKEVAHRDIKPSNIMIDKDNNVYLIDFGIAKELGRLTITQTGYQALTPSYAAPERLIVGKRYNPYLSDIYELGTTFMKLVGLMTPFEQAMSRKRIPSKTIKDSNLSSEIKKVLLTATHQDPLKRYESVDLMAKDINKVTQLNKKSNKLLFVSSILILFIVTIVIFFNLKTEFSKISRQVVDENSELQFLVATSNYSWQNLSLDIVSSNLPVGYNFQDNTNGTGTFNWIPSSSDSGEYSVTFAAYHMIWGRDTQTVSIFVENINQAPTLNPINDQIVDEGRNLELVVTANDLDGDEITLFASTLPENSSFEDNGSGIGLFRWTPNYENAGNYNVTIFVTDMSDTGLGSFAVTVNEVNTSPSIEQVREQNIQEEHKLKEPTISKYELQIDIIPYSRSSLFIDNVEESVGEQIFVDSGIHLIKIIHPDYPILIDSLDISVDIVMRYDLVEEYRNIGSLNILISTVPELGADNLIVKLNGKLRASYKKSDLPVTFDTPLIQGAWSLSFELENATNNLNKVDSFQILPSEYYNLRHFDSDSAIVMLIIPSFQKRRKEFFLIYWSSIKENLK